MEGRSWRGRRRRRRSAERRAWCQLRCVAARGAWLCGVRGCASVRADRLPGPRPAIPLNQVRIAKRSAAPRRAGWRPFAPKRRAALRFPCRGHHGRALGSFQRGSPATWDVRRRQSAPPRRARCARLASSSPGSASRRRVGGPASHALDWADLERPAETDRCAAVPPPRCYRTLPHGRRDDVARRNTSPTVPSFVVVGRVPEPGALTWSIPPVPATAARSGAADEPDSACCLRSTGSATVCCSRSRFTQCGKRHVDSSVGATGRSRAGNIAAGSYRKCLRLLASPAPPGPPNPTTPGRAPTQVRPGGSRPGTRNIPRAQQTVTPPTGTKQPGLRRHHGWIARAGKTTQETAISRLDECTCPPIHRGARIEAEGNLKMLSPIHQDVHERVPHLAGTCGCVPMPAVGPDGAPARQRAIEAPGHPDGERPHSRGEPESIRGLDQEVDVIALDRKAHNPKSLATCCAHGPFEHAEKTLCSEVG